MKLLLHKNAKKVKLNVTRQLAEQLPDPDKLIYYIHIKGLKCECSKAQYDNWPWRHRSTSYDCA